MAIYKYHTDDSSQSPQRQFPWELSSLVGLKRTDYLEVTLIARGEWCARKSRNDLCRNPGHSTPLGASSSCHCLSIGHPFLCAATSFSAVPLPLCHFALVYLIPSNSVLFPAYLTEFVYPRLILGHGSGFPWFLFSVLHLRVFHFFFLASFHLARLLREKSALGSQHCLGQKFPTRSCLSYWLHSWLFLKINKYLFI